MPSLTVWYVKVSKGDPFIFKTDRDFAMILASGNIVTEKGVCCGKNPRLLYEESCALIIKL
jgi:hypothetical protein